MDIVSKLQLEENDTFVCTNAENIPWFMPMQYPSTGDTLIYSQLLNVKTEDGKNTVAHYVLRFPHLPNNRGGNTYYGAFLELREDSYFPSDILDVDKHLKVTEWKELTKDDIGILPPFMRECYVESE